jgi:tetratricopeptide (TPR) repeat protein
MTRILLPLVAGWMAVGPALARPSDSDPLTPQYVSSRELVLSFTASADPPPVRTELWVSRDEGRAWTVVDHEAAGAGALHVRVPEDGRYAFYLVVESAAGRSGPPPTAGSRPHALVVVDTAAPVLQLHAARPESAEGGKRRLRFELSLVEEHLNEAAVRLFYRISGSDAWRDGGVLNVRPGQGAWTVPGGVGPSIDVCVTATDRAGNRALDELHGIVLLPSVPPATGSATIARPVEPSAEREAQPASLPAGAPDFQPTAPTAPDAGSVSRARRLRLLAQEYAAQGRLALAAARLQDALESLPDDPDLLAELGGVLYRAQRYDDATKRYEALLRRHPDHVGAIEGLALVAVTQRRYAEARGHLERLLTLAPETATHWLRYGDVQYQLGERDEAVRAWKRVLEIDGADRPLRQRAALRVERLAPERE